MGGGIYLYLHHPSPTDGGEELEKQPGNEEIYKEALFFINQKDSIRLQHQGKENLRILAEEKFYEPAKLEYYIVLLNSTKQEEVKKGFAQLQRIAQEDTLNNRALFECGLTLSKGNRFFNVPTVRQSLLNMEMDLEKANEWLYKSMDRDTQDYKSVYWAFNNLMEKKIAGSLPPSEDERITELYKLFEIRAVGFNDPTAALYKNAIKSDEETLKAWGLLN